MFIRTGVKRRTHTKRADNPQVRLWRRRIRRYAKDQAEVKIILVSLLEAPELSLWLKTPHPECMNQPPKSLMNPTNIRRLLRVVKKLKKERMEAAVAI